MIKYIFLLVMYSATFYTALAQATHTITDSERDFKVVKEHIAKEEYAFAYPLVKALLIQYPANTQTDHAYLNDDINYFYILCELKLQHAIGAQDALKYMAAINNVPRKETMSFHLAHYYFLKNDFENAVTYFNAAGIDNLSNEQIADAKFEKAYALFNLKRFEEAKPLFNEIHQLQTNKYYVAANYYYGFIAYADKQYGDALKAFKLVENYEEYKGVVPYYIAEIYYFQGDKEGALRYGESVLATNKSLYYDKQLKLLTGQIYFEQKNYQRALPLLEDYVNSAQQISKEVLYELSYSYYKAKQNAKAIEGFKQLSSEKDSMGQNSMYILGDLYLQTNQKENARNAFQFSAYNNSNPTQQMVSQFNYAKLSYELGYQDAALATMKAFLASHPNSTYSTEAKEILVNLLTVTNNFKDALALFESFDKPTASMQKAYPRILYGRAIEFINDQQLRSADELLQQVLANENAASVKPYAAFWRGEIAYREQRYNEAIQFLNSFLQSGAAAQGEANAKAANYSLGYSWLQKENYQQAQAAFTQVAGNINANSDALAQDAYLRSADAVYMQRNYQTANAMYASIIRFGLPQSDYAAYQQALIAGIKSNTEKINQLNNMVKQYPNSALIMESNMEIAVAYISDEKFDAAVPYLTRIINAPGEGLKPKAYSTLGLAYYNANNNSLALKNYTTLIEKYPNSSEADEALAVIKDIYVEEGKPAEYVALMRKNGKNVSVSEADSLTYSVALTKFDNGDCTGAIAAFEKYLGSFPEGAYANDAAYNLGTCYQKNKDFANANKYYLKVNERGISKYFEKATLEAARIYYFELKDYSKAKIYFEQLRTSSVNQDFVLEALRGLVRSNYFLKDYSTANAAAKQLVDRKGISTDDKSVGLLVLGKSQQVNNDCTAALVSFAGVANINKAAWGAEARYEIANCHFNAANLPAAEKAALSVIKETGSYDLWVTKSYLLLGDIFVAQKDFFNAKATYESIAKNAAIPELKAEAQQKLAKTIEQEKQQSKIVN